MLGGPCRRAARSSSSYAAARRHATAAGVMNSQSHDARRFADYFVICGLDTECGLEPDLLSGDQLDLEPLLRPYRGRVLHHYPDNVPWNPFDKDAVHMLCFPKGLSFSTSRRQREERFHPFLITREDGSRIYGAAYTFYEKVHDKGICDAMATLQQMHGAELSNAHSVTLYGGGGSQEKRPLKREDSIAYYNPSRDELFVTKCICVIMQKPFLRAAEQWLLQLHAAAMRCPSDASPDGTGLPLESHVYNLLYEVPLPLPGRSISFAAGRRRIVSQRPGPSELPLLDLPFEEVFQLLGIDKTILVLTCMLLEQRVLLRSADYYRLVLVAECLTHMMFPFAWQHVYVPILPASLEHFLDAPVPYIMGFCQRPDQSLCPEVVLNSDVCTVDIDKKDVVVPEDTPPFPYSHELSTELAALFKQHSAPLNSGDSKNNLLLTSGAFEEDDRSASLDGSSSDDSDVPAINGSSSSAAVTRAKPKVGSGVVDGSNNADSRLEALQDNETLARVAKIASSARVYGGSLKDVERQLAHEGRCIEEQRLWEIKERSRLKLSNALREVVFNRLLQLLVSYENFIIHPSPDTTMEQWLSSRETMLNFDTKAFLCDQPDVYLPFLCPFLETQMFATLIDNKIMSQWEEPDLSVSLLDLRLAALHSKSAAAEADSGAGINQPGHTYVKASYEETETLIERRAARIDYIAPAPRAFDGTKKHDTSSSGSMSSPIAPDVAAPTCAGCFPVLRPELLVGQRITGSDTSAFPRASPAYVTLKWRRADGQLLPLEQAKLNAEQRRSLTRRSSRIYDTNPVVIEETNSKFVAGLLKEVKSKTSRMVVNKMGHEAAALGHNSLIGLEENALIGGLCELLERIWTHGLQQKQPGRAPLWAHLTSFGDLSEMAERNKQVMTFQSPPPVNPSAPSSPGGTSPLPDLQQLFHDIADARGSKDRGHRRKGSSGSERMRPHLEPLPDNLLCDLRYVQKMKEVKTGVGKTRAWIRLCLEKKVLEKRLRELLGEAELCGSLYKRYAFLRCEEEREQALCHLLSLNAADFFCFTNTFTSTVMTYRLLVFPSKRFAGGLSTTTANAWISLAGHLRESDRFSIPKSTLEVVYEGQNLGVLSTVRIGHDNSGLSPKWLVDFVLVRNETTGHIYKFSCGRWLGKGVDDGSTERILVGELVSTDGLSDGALEAGQSSPRRTDSPKLTRQHSDKRRLTDKVDVERSLIDAVNGLVKYYCRPEKERGSVTVLLCGDGGLVASLEAAFQCGFKSARFLRNNYYLWDYIERVQSTLAEEGRSLDGPAQSFCDTVTTINNSAQSIGKDGKFQLLMCLAIRDHCLPQWLVLFQSTAATVQMYEESAFLRDESAVKAVAGALSSVHDFNICLEPSLTKGLQTSPPQQRS